MTYSLWLMDVVSDEFRSDKDAPVTALPGWQKNGWDTADHQGVMDHHQGNKPGSSFWNVVKWMSGGGYPYGPGFACNIATGTPYAPDLDNFPIVITAAGYVSHAGQGEWPWVTNLGLAGSAACLGIEHYSTYTDTDWHPRHLEVQMRLDACLLEHMGRSWTRRGDHKEWATPDGRKVDRHHLDTARWDRDLATLMQERSDTTGPTPPPVVPTPPPSEELTMADIEAIIQRFDALDRRISALPKNVWDDLHPHARTEDQKEKAWQVLNRIRVSNKVVLNRVLESVRVNAERGGTPDEIAKRVRAELASALDI